MRSLALAALAALTLGLMDARPADAARAGDSRHAGHHAAKAEKASARKAERRAKRAARHAGKRTRAARHHARKDTRSAKPRAAARRAATKRTAARRTSARRPAPTRSIVSGSGSTGIASYYWQPQRVASGGWFNPNALTAAHRTLPFGTRVKVTNKRNGRSVVVTINDRGPFIKGRIIDLSKRAAGVIGMQGAGLAPVSVQVVGRG